MQPFADRYGYGNKTRKLFNFRDVVCNLLRLGQNVVSEQAEHPGLISVPGFVIAPVRSAGPHQKNASSLLQNSCGTNAEFILYRSLKENALSGNSGFQLLR